MEELKLTQKQRMIFNSLRQACITILNQIDDLLGYPRTIPTKEFRRQYRRYLEQQEQR